MEEAEQDELLSRRMHRIIKHLFLDPDYIPTESGMHLATVTTMLGWNRSLGHMEDMEYQQEKLTAYWPDHKKYLVDFKRDDFNSLVDLVSELKEEFFPDDRRLIVSAGFVGGKLTVEHTLQPEQSPNNLN